MGIVIAPIKRKLVLHVKHFIDLFPTLVIQFWILVQVAPVASGVLLLPHFRQTFGVTLVLIASQLVNVPTSTHMVPLSEASVQSERAFPTTH